MLLKNALWSLCERSVVFYLRSNTRKYLSGSLKAEHHSYLCSVFAGIHLGIDADAVSSLDETFQAIRKKTRELTDHLDEVVQLPFDGYYDEREMAMDFFSHFYRLAMEVIEPKVHVVMAGSKIEGCFPVGIFERAEDAFDLKRKMIDYDQSAPPRPAMKFGKDRDSEMDQFIRLDQAWLEDHPAPGFDRSEVVCVKAFPFFVGGKET